MTRGGKREGAGRPLKENKKKMFSFRLDEQEEKAVKDLLKKMRETKLKEKKGLQDEK